MTEDRSGSKFRKTVLTIAIAICALVLLVFLGARLYFRVPVSAYYQASEKSFVIPGLSDGLVPQGIDHLEKEGLYLVGGHQKDGSPSRVYLVEKQSGKTKGYVTLGDENGSGISPHAGGLAAHGDRLYVAGAEPNSIYVYKLSDVLSAGKGEVMRREGVLTLKPGVDDSMDVAFLCFTDEGLIAGEFYREPNYPTLDSHIIKTGGGEENHALAFCFRYSENADFGIEETPYKAYSLSGLVQGMTVEDGKIWTSRSWGTARSTISCYDLKDSEPVAFRMPANGAGADTRIKGVPVYALESGNKVKEFEAPPMSEEIIFVDGKLLTMCESASGKYFFGNLTGGRWCYATDACKLG